MLLGLSILLPMVICSLISFFSRIYFFFFYFCVFVCLFSLYVLWCVFPVLSVFFVVLSLFLFVLSVFTLIFPVFCKKEILSCVYKKNVRREFKNPGVRQRRHIWFCRQPEKLLSVRASGFKNLSLFVGKKLKD